MKATLRTFVWVLLSLAILPIAAHADAASDLQSPDNKNIHYIGRFDFTNPKLPRVWSPGAYIQAKFRGTYCNVDIDDQVLWGTSHNWIEIVVDDLPPQRVQTTGPTNTFVAAKDLPDGVHTITICKDTEAGIGYIEFAGLHCKSLVRDRLPKRKIEFIGDSITCGYGNDTTTLACHKGSWYDNHNAYLAYGPVTARAVDAQWVLTSVSGIGMYHNCCGRKLTMPEVFDRINLEDPASAGWDFHRYQPDVVTICLGQNDGPDNPESFRMDYVEFIHTVRRDYPHAEIICLSSPMADDNLHAVMQANLNWIVDQVTEAGDKHVHTFDLPDHLNAGCDAHPDLAQDQTVADKLAGEIKSVMHW